MKSWLFKIGDVTNFILAIIMILSAFSLVLSVQAQAIDFRRADQQTNPQDEERVSAEQAFAEAEQLRTQSTPDFLRRALIKYEYALQLMRNSKDRSGEAKALNKMGLVYLNLKEPVKALQFLNEALPIWEALGNEPGKAENLNNTGGAYYLMGDMEKSLRYFNQAVTPWLLVGDRRALAQTYKNLGAIYYIVSKDKDRGKTDLWTVMDLALMFSAHARKLYKELGDSQGEAEAISNFNAVFQYYNRELVQARAIGNRIYAYTMFYGVCRTYYYLGEYQKALESFNTMRQYFRTNNLKDWEGIVLLAIGEVYQAIGERQKAVDYYLQAYSAFKDSTHPGNPFVALQKISDGYSALGDYRKAIEYSDQVVSISRKKFGKVYINDLNKIALRYTWLGEYQKALNYYNQALELAESQRNYAMKAMLFTNIGYTYDLLGDKQRALDYYSRSLSIKQMAGLQSSTVLTLIAIVFTHSTMNNHQKALEFYRQALPIVTGLQDDRTQGIVLGAMGISLGALGNKEQALEHLKQGLGFLRAAGDRVFEATALTNIGLIYDMSGDAGKALASYSEALSICRSINDRRGEAAALLGIARIESKRGNLTEARARIEAALLNIELLRTKTSSQELRSSYFSSVQQYYEFYIDLLIQMHKQNPSAGFDAIALQASERARARSLLEMLRESGAEIRRGVDPVLLERERSLQQSLSTKGVLQLRLLTGLISDESEPALEKDIESINTEYQQVLAKIRIASPHYAALTQPQPLTLQEIQNNVLDPDTLLLEYELGDQRSYLWAVSSTTITSYELPGRVEIEEAAKRFYNLLTEPNQMLRTASQDRELVIRKVEQLNKETSDVAQKLTRILLEPVYSQLGSKRLIVVADGVLQYIPFAALPEPVATVDGQSNKQPLIVKHEIISLPSASIINVLRQEAGKRKSPAKTLAVLADPVFDKEDERVKGDQQREAEKQSTAASGERGLIVKAQTSAEQSGIKVDQARIPRLPGTRQEAEKILGLVPTDSRLQAVDFAANREIATSSELSNYRIIHFATHSLANSTHPELSGILLSMVDEKGAPQNGFLQAHEVYNLNMPADLVVLSACQTALGKDVKGEGIIGLTRGFMYAGASTVVASLWEVNDEATAELMVKFYRNMLKDRLRPSEALRAAQIAMWKEKRWEAPYYWAAFTLQGEWK